MGMEVKLNILRVITASAAIAFAPVAYAQEAEFSEVDVFVQLGDSSTANALRFWPTIEPDMEAVMRQRISTLYNPNGFHVTVNLSEVSLDGTKSLSDDGAFNTLRGLAILRETPDGPVVKMQEFGLRAQPWEVSVTEGMFVLNDKAEFYNAMLNNFADEMVTQINGE